MKRFLAWLFPFLVFAGPALAQYNPAPVPSAGDTGITAVGTVTAGTWAATNIAVAHGGSGTNALAGNGAVIMNAGGTAQTVVAPSTAANAFMSNGTAWISKGVFQSADQTITAAGALTLAHGLAWTPQRVWAALVNQTGELGYTAGQVVFVQGSQTVSTVATENGGFSAIVDGTNLTVRYGSDASTFAIPHATTGVATAITNANWKCRFFAL